MSSTTNINDLPTDPTGGNNVSLNISEKQQGDSHSGPVSLDQTTINQIISGIQTASAAGATQLPGRDIPRNTEGLTQDVQIKPNYIPPQQNTDYINNSETNNDVINEYNDQFKQSNSLDELYDEIQVPLLLAVLYFIFQLPIVRKWLLSYLPFLFHIDGNFNINGYVITSMIFGTLYYILSKAMKTVNQI